MTTGITNDKVSITLMQISQVTTKGQVTIPADIRKLFGMTPHSKVSFIVKDNEVKIAPAKSVVAATAGIFKSDIQKGTIEEETIAVEEAIAEEAMM